MKRLISSILLSFLILLPLSVYAVRGLVEINNDGTAALSTATGLPLTTGVTGDLPYANMVPATAISILVGRGAAAGAGDLQEITLGANLTMTGTTLAATGASLPTVVSKTTTYTALTTDNTILADGTFTITLYTAVGNSGRTLNIKNIGTGVITIDPNGTETVDLDATSLVISIQHTSITIQSDGTNWWII